MRFPFALVAQHAARNWFRSLLTIGSVFIAIFVFGAMRTVIHSLEVSTTSASSHRMVTESAVSLFVALPKKLVHEMRATPGVAEATDLTWFGGTYVVPENHFARFAVDPVPFRKVYAADMEMSDAEWKAFEETRTGCIIGEGLQGKFGFEIGSRIPLQGGAFTGLYELIVVGVYKARTQAFDPSQLFFHWDYMNEVSKRNDGAHDVVSVFLMLLDDASLGPSVAREIDDRYANSRHRTRTMTERAFQAQFLSMFGSAPFFFNFLSLVALVATLMVTLNTMLLNAAERVREVGVLKTLGFGTAAVVAVFLVESMMLCLVGGLLGVAAFQLLDGTVLPGLMLPLFVSPQTTVTAIVISFGLGLASGLAPSIEAARLRIVEALRSQG